MGVYAFCATLREAELRNVAIVEDEKQEANKLASYLSAYGKKTGENFRIFAFPDAERFLTGYTADYDAVFMDIELPGMNGMDASRELRKLDRNVVLVFVTNMSQFAAEGYSVDAFDFLLKPVSYSDFYLKFTRIMNKIKSSDDVTIIIRGKEFARRVFSSDIKYVEVRNHLLTYHLESGDISAPGTMKSALEQLGDVRGFALCNQSYLVNLRYVGEFGDSEVNVGGDVLAVSRPKRREFFKAVNLYFNGREAK